jgi:hypothetical protein
MPLRARIRRSEPGQAETSPLELGRRDKRLLAAIAEIATAVLAIAERPHDSLECRLRRRRFAVACGRQGYLADLRR